MQELASTAPLASVEEEDKYDDFKAKLSLHTLET